MRNMSIRAKLVFGFAAIVVFNVCFGFYSLYSLSVLNRRVVDANEWTVGLAEIAALQMDVSAVYQAELSYLNQASHQRRAETKKTRDAYASSVAELSESYRKDVTELEYDTEEQRAKDMKAIDEIIRLWGVYMAVSDKIIDFVDNGERQSALELQDGEGRKAYEDVKAASDYLAEYNGAQSAESAEFSNGIFLSTRRIVIALLVIVTIFSTIMPIVMIGGIRRSISELLRVSKALGDGNLRVSASVHSEDELGTLSKHYNTAIGNVKTLISQIQESAEYMLQASEEMNASTSQSAEGTRIITENIEKVSYLSNTQLKNIEAMVDAIENMSSNIARTGEMLDTSARAAQLAVEKARGGGEAIDQAIEQMGRIENTVDASAQVVISLGERSSEIGQIVETIAGISSQTNLLALNAAIEAARAGEHGRGFAVVADEVKKLAGESQSAAEEISKLINSIQSETTRAVTAMDEGRREVKQGAEVVREGGQAFGDLADMSVENASQLEKVVETLNAVDSIAKDIVASARDIEEASRKISDESESVVAATQEQNASMSDMSQSSRDQARIAGEMNDATRSFAI